MTQWFESCVPQSTKWQPQVVTTFIQALLKLNQDWMDFEIVCTHNRIRFILASSDENGLSLETVRSATLAYYPGAKVFDPEGWGSDYPFHRRYHVFTRNETNFFETFASVYQQKSLDLLSIVCTAMERLEPGETLTYHVHVINTHTHSQDEIFDLLTISAYDRGDRYMLTNYYRKDVWEIAGASIANWFRNHKLKKERVPRYDERDLERYRAKLSQPLANVAVYLCLDSPKPERLTLLSTIAAAVRKTADQGVAQLLEGIDRSAKITNAEEANRFWPARVVFDWLLADDPEQAKLISPHELIMSLTADEVASLWHLPHEGFTATKIQWVDESVKPLPEPLKSAREGIQLGVNGEFPVYLSPDEQTQHVIIVGKPGTGKSTLLIRMIMSDLAQGHGAVVIDPNGSLVKFLLNHGIPAARERDLVLLDFGNLTNPPPLNPLSRPHQVEKDIAASMLMTVMTTLYPELAGKEMAETLHMALMTIAAADQPNLLDIIRLFDDPEFRNGLVARLADYPVTAFWRRFDHYTPARQDELTRPVLRRLNAFFSNRYLRGIVCHPAPLDIRQLVADNKIVLVSLWADEAKMPTEQQRLLGAVLVAQIQMAALAGAITQPPFMLYMDEAQHFVTTALPRMLAEARKQGLGIVLANQYLEQLVGATLDAIEGTVGTMVGFEVGESDAKALVPYLKPSFQVNDLVKLGKFRAAVSLRYQNSRQPAFTLETLPPPQVNGTDGAREQHLRRLSVERYTPKTYSEVHDWLNHRYHGQTPTADPISTGESDHEFIDTRPEAKPQG